MEIQIKRIYEEETKDDGLRVLVDRVWPRGVSKEKADIDVWAKDLAPSTDARKEFDHKPENFDTFRNRYTHELEEREDAHELIEKIKAENPKKLTLLYGAKDKECNHAIILQEYLQKHIAGASFADPRSV